MKKQRKQRHRRRGSSTSEIRLLQEMNATLARVEDRLDTVGDLSIKPGAIAGAAAGGLVGAIVSLFVTLVKSRFGL